MPRVYSVKPRKVEADRVNHDTMGTLARWCGGEVRGEGFDKVLIVPRLGGSLNVRSGDWLIKDSRGVFHRVTNDDFEETYQPIGIREVTINDNLSAVRRIDSAYLI